MHVRDGNALVQFALARACPIRPGYGTAGLNKGLIVVRFRFDGLPFTVDTGGETLIHDLFRSHVFDSQLLSPLAVHSVQLF